MALLRLVESAAEVMLHVVPIRLSAGHLRLREDGKTLASGAWFEGVVSKEAVRRGESRLRQQVDRGSARSRETD